MVCRWSFMKSTSSYKKLQISDTLEKAKLSDLATLLMAEGFEVCFLKALAAYYRITNIVLILTHELRLLVQERPPFSK